VNHHLRISPRLLALIPSAVAINLVVGTVVRELALPVYLDTMGTVLISVLSGVPAGVIVGGLSQLLIGLLTGYQYLPFVVIQWVLALLVVFVAWRRGFRNLWISAAWGVACGALCGAVSAVISYQFFGGVTGGGVAWIVAALRSAGVPLPIAVAASSLGTDVLDKAIVIVMIGVLLRSLPRRIVGRFPRAARAVNR
jgi:energy-coupling factor transport system substrate-specific component